MVQEALINKADENSTRKSVPKTQEQRICHTLATPSLQKLGQEILRFEASLDYTVRFFPNKANKNNYETTRKPNYQAGQFGLGQELRWPWAKMPGSAARVCQGLQQGVTTRTAPKGRTNSIRDILGQGKVSRLCDPSCHFLNRYDFGHVT